MQTNMQPNMHRITPTSFLHQPAALLLAAVCALAQPLTASAADPTSGSIVLFPGDMPDNNYGGGDAASGGNAASFAGWNIPGRHFRAGSGWWSFACAKECTLSPATLSIRAGTHPDYDGPPLPSQLLSWSPLPYQLGKQKVASTATRDANPDAATDTTATAPTRKPGDPVLLAMFKPIGAQANMRLAAGTVPTRLHRGMPDYPPAKPVRGFTEMTIDIGQGKKAILRERLIRPAKAPEPGQVADNRLLIDLEIDGVRQTLGAYTFHMEPASFIPPKQYLLWAGDLDGDGKLDLMVNLSGYYWETTLFLSSLAQPGKLVGKGGTFSFSPPDSPGC